MVFLFSSFANQFYFIVPRLKCKGYFLGHLCGIVIMLYNDCILLCLICVHMERLGVCVP